MRRFKLVIMLALVGIILAVGRVGAQDGDSLIRNGDFAHGLNYWAVDQPCSSCWMDVQVDAASGGNVLAWERTNAGGSGSAIMARQMLGVDVSGYAHLRLALEVRVNSHSLPNSGWWSDEHGGSGEYPVKLSLAFTDAAGQSFEWSRGYLITHDGSTALRNYQVVPAGQWVTVDTDVFEAGQWLDARGNPLPAPAQLTSLAIGGSGWDFSGAARGVVLTTEGGDTGSEMISGLVVEEYPLVSAAEDTPDHFEFKQRLTDQILNVRWTWRNPDPTVQIAQISQAISAWGYSLVPTPGDPNATALYYNDAPLVTDITHVWPLAVSASGTDFRLLVDSMSQSTLVVLPDTVGQVDSTHFVSIAPVFVGDDLIEVYADWDRPAFEVRRNGQTEYVLLPQEPFVEPPVKALFAWNGHWVLQTDTAAIIDGQSLNEQIGAAEVIGWQLIVGQPFYFFTYEGRLAMSYAGQIVEPYRYDQIVHDQCCEGSMFNLSGNGTMVWFYALRDGMWLYVEAGVYG